MLGSTGGGDNRWGTANIELRIHLCVECLCILIREAKVLTGFCELINEVTNVGPSQIHEFMDIGQTKSSSCRGWRRRGMGAPKYVSKGCKPMTKQATKKLLAPKTVEQMLRIVLLIRGIVDIYCCCLTGQKSLQGCKHSPIKPICRNWCAIKIC